MAEQVQDPRFKGGGTPINNLVQQAPPMQQPPMQQPPMQQPPMQPQMHPRQQQSPMMGQPPMYYQGMQGSAGIDKLPLSEKFENFTNCSPVKFFSLVILIILFNNSLVYDLEKNFIPPTISYGSPPILAVILNAFIIGLVFLLICKFS